MNWQLANARLTAPTWLSEWPKLNALQWRRTLQSGGRRLATAVEVSINVDAHRTADAPFHYWRPRISSRGFACMEQPAIQCHLIDVIDSFQAAPQNRTLPPMFLLGLCLTILLSLFCIMLDSEHVLSVVKCSCSPRILWHFNHTRYNNMCVLSRYLHNYLLSLLSTVISDLCTLCTIKTQ